MPQMVTRGQRAPQVAGRKQLGKDLIAVGSTRQREGGRKEKMRPQRAGLLLGELRVPCSVTGAETLTR